MRASSLSVGGSLSLTASKIITLDSQHLHSIHGLPSPQQTNYNIFSFTSAKSTKRDGLYNILFLHKEEKSVKFEEEMYKT